MNMTKKLSVKKLFVIFITFIMLIASAFLGLQTTQASADSSGVIQLSIYASHGSDNSTGNDVGLGHAWIVVENGTNSSYSFYNTTLLAGETFSIGTWGNRKDPDTGKTKKVAWLNLEAYFGLGTNSTASLTITITPTQLATVSAKCISKNDWSAIKNCSYFAEQVWNSVAPSNMKVDAYTFPAYFPSELKKSIKKISGYQTNRSFASNDYTGYCTSSTNFKYIEASRIGKGSSSSSSSSSSSLNTSSLLTNNVLFMNDFYTSFPTEFNTEEKILQAYQISQE